MAIESIPIISVSAIELPVYTYDFQVATVENPASISISFIDENGNYGIPQLSTITPVTIKVGEIFQYNYYPISYELKQAPNGGKILSMKFVDKSFLLDKIHVGLTGKHGFVSTDLMVIVGDYIDPCQKIIDGAIQGETVDDPCNPCTTNGKPVGQGELQERLIQCDQERSIGILDIHYNFEDLLNAIEESTSIGFGDERPVTNNDYRTNYSGTLRSVLQNWCSDYGFTFYWDEEDIIQFVDVRTGIQINDAAVISSSKILSKSQSETLEGTVSRGTIGYFNKEGAVRDYKCDLDWCKKLNLRPMNIQAIVGDPGYYLSLLRLELMCTLSYYSPALRDAYVWFDWGAIHNATVLKAREGESIHLLGMQIKKVFDPAIPADKIISEKILREIFNEDEEGLRDFYTRGGYFFIASYDKERHSSSTEFESALASEFIGKYYVRKFTQNFVSSSYSYLTPDADSVKYYKRTDPLQLPFINLLKDASVAVTAYLNNLLDTSTDEAADNFLLLEKNAVWFPLRESEEIKEIGDLAEKEHFKELGQLSISNFGYEIKEDEKEQWFIGYKNVAEIRVINAGLGDNPSEVDNVRVSVEACNLGSVYGLRSAKTQRFIIESSGGSVNVFMPAQANIDAPGGADLAGYDIIWEKSGSFPTSIVQPKIELVTRLMPTIGENTLSVEVNIQDITQDVYDLFGEVADSTCYPRTEIITNRMSEIIAGLDLPSTPPLKRVTYELGGLPNTQYLIRDGLESMNIRIGDDGLVTNITFSNSVAQPISQNLFYYLYSSIHKKVRPKVFGSLTPPFPTSIQDI